MLSRLEKDETFYIVAEIGGKVVGGFEINRRLGGYETYIGVLGITIRNGFRKPWNRNRDDEDFGGANSRNGFEGFKAFSFRN